MSVHKHVCRHVHARVHAPTHKHTFSHASFHYEPGIPFFLDLCHNAFPDPLCDSSLGEGMKRYLTYLNVYSDNIVVIYQKDSSSVLLNAATLANTN